MKIVFITHGFPPEFRGGSELYVERVAHAAREMGHEVYILAGSGDVFPMPKTSFKEENGLPVTRIHRTGLFVDEWHKSYSPQTEELVREYLLKIRPDLVHINHWIRLSRNLVSTCRDLRIPCLITLHDLWSTCPQCFRVRDEEFCEREVSEENCMDCISKDWWQKDYEIRDELNLFRTHLLAELRGANRLIVPSSSHQNMLAMLTGFPPERFFVVPHPPIFSMPKKVHPGPRFPEAPLRIGHWGHLYPFKGAHVLLEAVDLLKEPGRVELHIFGKAHDQEYRSRLDGLAKGKKVIFHGPFTHEDLLEEPLDLAVIPTLCRESYSFVLDEAFQMGLPVLASHLGAMKERIGKGGRCFQTGDRKDLAGKIQEILENPPLLRQMEEGIPREGFSSVEEHMARLVEIYREVVVEGSRSGGDGFDYLQVLSFKARQVEDRNLDILKLEGRLGKVTGEKEGLERHVKGLEKHANNLENEMERIREHAKNLEASIGEHQRAMGELRGHLGSMEKEIRRQEKVIGKYEAAAQEADRVIERLMKVERELNTIKSKKWWLWIVRLRKIRKWLARWFKNENPAGHP